MTDLRLYEQLVENARKHKAEAAQRASEGKYPTGFLEAGTYEFRVYPEIENNHLYAYRKLRVHMLPEGLGWFRCVDGCRICPQVARLDEAGLTKKNSSKDQKDPYFQFRGQDLSTMKVALYKGPKSEYINIDSGHTPLQAVLYLRWQATDAWEGFLSGLEPPEVAQLFEDVQQRCISLEWKKVSNRWQAIVAVPAFGSSVGLPPLPEDFPTQQQVPVGPEDVPNEEQFAKIATHISRIIQGELSFVDPQRETSPAVAATPTIVLPTPGGNGATAPQTAPAVLATPAPVAAAPAAVQTATVVPLTDTQPKCPAEKEGLKFGAHPNQFSLACCVCTLEAACVTATSKTAGK